MIYHAIMMTLLAPWHVSEGASEGVHEAGSSEIMAETGAKFAASSSTTLPLDNPTPLIAGRALRKCASSEISGQNRFQGPNGAYLAACQYFMLCGLH